MLAACLCAVGMVARCFISVPLIPSLHSGYWVYISPHIHVNFLFFSICCNEEKLLARKIIFWLESNLFFPRPWYLLWDTIKYTLRVLRGQFLFTASFSTQYSLMFLTYFGIVSAVSCHVQYPLAHLQPLNQKSSAWLFFEQKWPWTGPAWACLEIIGWGGALFHGTHNDLLTYPDWFASGLCLDNIVSTNQIGGEK